MDKIKYIGATSPWRDDLTGSGLTWTTGQEANVADHIGNVARGYTSHFQMVDDGVKVTADSSGTLYRDDTQSPVSGDVAAPDVSFDPAGHPDGPLPAGPDTSQPWTAFASPTAPAPLRIYGGEIVHTVHASAQSAGYLQIDCGEAVTRMGAMVAWPANAIGSVAFVIPSAPWATGVLPNAGVHLVVNGNGIWRMDRYVAGVGLDVIADYTTHGRFTTVWDGVFRPLEIYIDRSAGTCRCVWPDGTFSDMSSPYFTSETSQWATWELYEASGGATVPARLGRIWAGTDEPQHAAGALTTRSDVVDILSGQKRLVREFTTPGSGGDSIMPGCVGVYVTLISSGSGGGSGRRGAAGTVRKGGGSGGPGGVIRDVFIPRSALGTSYSVTVPAGGLGGAAVTTDNTDGNVGSAGSSAVFTSGSATLHLLGAAPGATFDAAGYGYKSLEWGTVSGVAASATGGVGAAGSNTNGDVPGPSGSGGGITSADVPGNGGAGKTSFSYSQTGAGATGGVVGGALPGAGTAVPGSPGAGAGGGAASITAAAQAGADAAGYGVAGAGGGASLNGFASGRGGNAGPGYVRVVQIII